MTAPASEAARLEEHRAALTGHCYRMLGSASEADDAVQETMVRAWRGLDRLEERAAIRSWLYRIATNVCIDALADRSRRERPVDLGADGTVDDPLVALERAHWVEPVSDARALPADADPAELAVLRQSIRLAFVAALQHLPPRQRAALILTEVVGWSAAEVAEALAMSVPAVNSALQRARSGALDRAQTELAKPAPPLTSAQTQLLERYVAAFERYDVDELTSLLRQDVAFSMPPYSLWLRGSDKVAAWLLGRGAKCRGSRLVPTAACASPAFAQYHPTPDGGLSPWALVVLDVEGDKIGGWTSFLDTATLFPLFGLPISLTPEEARQLGART